MGGQSAAVIFLLVGDSLRNKSPFSDEPKDTMATALICVAAVATCISFLAFCFSAPYYRLEAEAEANNRQNNRERERV